MKKFKINDNTLIASNFEIEIAINEIKNKNKSTIELETEAALMLLEHVQYKYFEEQIGGEEGERKFEEFIKTLDDTVHGIKAWSGLIED